MSGVEGRVVVVTGAGRGMGFEHAKALAAAGAMVVLNDSGANRDGTGSDPSVANEAAEQIRAAGGDVVANTDDVRTMAGAESLVKQAIDTYGDIHGLVNNAGILRDKMFVNMSFEDWDECIRGHLGATFAPTRIACAHWRDQSKAGAAVNASVVSMSSTSGLIGQVGQTNYGAAKAGIAALTVILAQEVRRYGVRVNAITPVARTRMTEEAPGVADLVRRPADPAEFDTFDPANVSPMVLWLLGADCPATGEVFYARGKEIRHYVPWSFGEVITTDGPWSVEQIDTALRPIVTPAE